MSTEGACGNRNCDTSQHPQNDRLADIEPNLKIKVLFADNDLVIVEKPCNLRSVPGHAYSPTEKATRKRPRPEQDRSSTNSSLVGGKGEHTSDRKTAQQAWEAAILSFVDEQYRKRDVTSEADNLDHDVEIYNFLKRLATSGSMVASVPRKQKLFIRYIQRNQKRVFEGASDQPAEKMEQISSKMYLELQNRQKIFLNLPEPTRHEDSAYGQLVLMGYDGKNQDENKLFVVHRLDCETSGVMVFARNQKSSAMLCKAWRERDEVCKIYLAQVKHWPPFHDSNLVEGSINAPLTPSDERLKWKVTSGDDPKGKASTTSWWIDSSSHAKDDGASKSPVLLKLKPLTGRTHQLRIHCAHVGSGIIGDSLYGEDRLEHLGERGEFLRLHAHKLSFVHPGTNERCEFTSNPKW